MGYVDEDGYLFLNGRNAETIISGGVNIYPQEIDSQLLKHPAVVDVCTVGVPNDEWGEEVKSVVSWKPGQASATMRWRRGDRVCAVAFTGVQGAAFDRFVGELPRLPAVRFSVVSSAPPTGPVATRQI